MKVIAEIRRQTGCSDGVARQLVRGRKVWIGENVCTGYGEFEGELSLEGPKKVVKKVEKKKKKKKPSWLKY